MRAADRLVAELLDPGFVPESLHAFIFQPGATAPEHRLLDKKDELRLKYLTQQGIRSVVLDPQERRLRRYPAHDEAFDAFLKQHYPTRRMGQEMQAAEQRAERDRDAQHKAKADQEATAKTAAEKEAFIQQHGYDPDEYRDFQAQAKGGGLVTASGIRLGGTFRTDKGAQGAVITQVDPGSALEQAGLRQGDALMRLAGLLVRDATHLQQLLRSLTPKVPYTVTFARRGRWLKTRIVPS